jgi:hypothetical protein
MAAGVMAAGVMAAGVIAAGIVAGVAVPPPVPWFARVPCSGSSPESSLEQPNAPSTPQTSHTLAQFLFTVSLPASARLASESAS